jgi:hypothetical protein
MNIAKETICGLISEKRKVKKYPNGKYPPIKWIRSGLYGSRSNEPRMGLKKSINLSVDVKRNVLKG